MIIAIDFDGTCVTHEYPYVGKDIGAVPVLQQFESPEYGVRAATKLIKTHYNRGNNTLTKLINVWAPPNENHTNNYIKYLSKKLNIDPNTQLNIDTNSLFNLINEMTYFENGQYGDPEIIKKGINLK